MACWNILSRRIHIRVIHITVHCLPPRRKTEKLLHAPEMKPSDYATIERDTNVLAIDLITHVMQWRFDFFFGLDASVIGSCREKKRNTLCAPNRSHVLIDQTWYSCRTLFLDFRMAVIEAVGKRRRARRAPVESSATPVRQDFGLLHVVHGQGADRRTRSSSGLVRGRKRPKSSGKYLRESICS